MRKLALTILTSVYILQALTMLFQIRGRGFVHNIFRIVYLQRTLEDAYISVADPGFDPRGEGVERGLCQRGNARTHNTTIIQP